MQPGTGQGPLTPDGSPGHSKNLSCLGDAQSREKTQANDLSHPAIPLLEASDGVSYGNDLFGPRFLSQVDGAQGDSPQVAASLDAPSFPGVLDEDAAHGLRRRDVEMAGVVEVALPRTDQAEVGFVDESGRLEGMVRALSCHL
jgi:hypothetical protein